MRIIGVIPARFGSSRFPGKPLHPIAGKPLVQHVVEQCKKAESITEIIVATDDRRIAAAVEGFARVIMTREDHPSGTDRIAEVASLYPADAYVNIQGDEPLIEPSVIDAVAKLLTNAQMTTAVTPISNADDYENPNVVKAVVAQDGYALYFSRRTIPYLRDQSNLSPAQQLAAFPFLRHLGIYGFHRETLLRIVAQPPSPLEVAERLEQLRALELGIRIAVATVIHDSIGVDVPGDVQRVEGILNLRSRGHASANLAP
jgi:3-deoxy-manno-octulosonate cytidylyltransferase (CMP-KDO synthetase)